MGMEGSPERRKAVSRTSHIPTTAKQPRPAPAWLHKLREENPVAAREIASRDGKASARVRKEKRHAEDVRKEAEALYGDELRIKREQEIARELVDRGEIEMDGDIVIPLYEPPED
jgi:hypothetical protein